MLNDPVAHCKSVIAEEIITCVIVRWCDLKIKKSGCFFFSFHATYIFTWGGELGGLVLSHGSPQLYLRWITGGADWPWNISMLDYQGYTLLFHRRMDEGAQWWKRDEKMNRQPRLRREGVYNLSLKLSLMDGWKEEIPRDNENRKITLDSCPRVSYRCRGKKMSKWLTKALFCVPL